MKSVNIAPGLHQDVKSLQMNIRKAVAIALRHFIEMDPIERDRVIKRFSKEAELDVSTINAPRRKAA